MNLREVLRMKASPTLWAENEELRQQLEDKHPFVDVRALQRRAEAAEATMREVAEELRDLGNKRLIKLADRLDPPPKEHKDE